MTLAKRMQFGKREHRNAHGQIRTSPEVQAELRRIEASIRADLGDGYESAVTVNDRVPAERTRARLGVWTRTYEAKLDNAKNDSLVRALARRIR